MTFESILLFSNWYPRTTTSASQDFACDPCGHNTAYDNSELANTTNYWFSLQTERKMIIYLTSSLCLAAKRKSEAFVIFSFNLNGKDIELFVLQSKNDVTILEIRKVRSKRESFYYQLNVQVD